MNEERIQPNNYTTTALNAGRAEQEKQSISVPNDPQSFLSDGNKHFVFKRFTSAIASYTMGIKHFKEEEEEADIGVVENEPKSEEKNKSSLKSSNSILELYSNRALSYISIGNYVAALDDTRQVLLRDSAHFKAVFRQAKALAGLCQYQEAINFLNSSIKLFYDNSSGSRSGHTQKKENLYREQVKELENYISKLKWMKHQSETGDHYDLPEIMDKPFEPAPVDWVDYIGPVKVKSIEGKGRGLVAAKDLPASKLILACRCFEIIFLDGKSDPENGLSEESNEALNAGTFKIEDDTTLNLLARKVYDRLIQNPEKRSDFYQLHAGNDLGFIEPSVDRANNIPPLDMARIYGICRTNTFANSGDSYPEVEKSVGVWLFPAFVNHKCIGGNCTWKIFGDFIFVRTYKAVKKGEELCHSYVSPAFPFKARTEVLTKRLEFVCDCVLCELDRDLLPSVQEEKDKLKLLVQNQDVKFAQLDPNKNSQDYAKKVQASINLLEQIISKLEKIQPKHGPYNASLLDPLQKLGLKYFGIGEFQKAAKVLEKAVDLMKSCMLPHGVADCSLWIIAGYLQSGNTKLAKKWGKVLRESLILAYGDVKVLKILGSWVMEPMAQWGLMT